MVERNLEDLIKQAREKLIKALEKALKTHGPAWINRDIYERMVNDLKSKRPVKISGPFEGDYMDYVLSQLGFSAFDEKGEEDLTYRSIWKGVEEGK